MRFGQPNTRPCDHECRVFRKFLWWPFTVGSETRWLEFADSAAIQQAPKVSF